MLFLELVTKLRRIAAGYGPGAAWLELALQSAVADEQAAFEKDELKKAGQR